MCMDILFIFPGQLETRLAEVGIESLQEQCYICKPLRNSGRQMQS